MPHDVVISKWSIAVKRNIPTSPLSGHAAFTSQLCHPMLLACHSRAALDCEVGAFYWTDVAPDIVNPGREEQG